MSKVVIKGAGIAGVTTAYMAWLNGHQVIVEDFMGVAERCSKANGGQISVSNAETWTTYSNVIKGAKWLFNKEAPLQFRLDHWSLAKAKWILGFLGATISNAHTKNTKETIELATKSSAMLLDLLVETQIDIEKQQCGIMHVYRNEKMYEKAVKSCEKYNWDRRPYSVAAANIVEPNFNWDGVVGCTFTASDWTGDINLFCVRLSEWLQNQGVEFLTTYEGPRDTTIFCTGVDTPKYMKSRVYPVKGYSLTFNSSAGPLASILDDENKIVTSSYDGRFRVAGTAELAGYDYSLREDRLRPLYKWVKENTNVQDDGNAFEYACLRPMTPNMMPEIYRDGDKIVNTGAGHLGWTMCMSLAEKTVALL